MAADTDKASERWTWPRVAGVVLLVLIAMCQADMKRREVVYCPGSPYVVPGVSAVTWARMYARDTTPVRSGPAPDDSVLRRVGPGSEIHVRFDGEWARVIGPDGGMGGWVAAGDLRGTPFTMRELRALSRSDRAALRRELMEGMTRDSGASGVRIHPASAPDFLGLYAVHGGPGAATMDSARRAALPGAPFALYADVEERADSVRLVLVAALRSDQPLTWTQVAMVPQYGTDTLWNTRGQPPAQLLTRPWSPARQPERVRFLALAADSALREKAWSYTRTDSIQMRLREPGCTTAYLVPEADKDRLRRSLRLYELSAAERL